MRQTKGNFYTDSLGREGWSLIRDQISGQQITIKLKYRPVLFEFGTFAAVAVSAKSLWGD